MTLNATFAEILSALEQNTELLDGLTRYPADNVENLRKVLYLADRVTVLSQELADKVVADIQEIQNLLGDLPSIETEN